MPRRIENIDKDALESLNEKEGGEGKNIKYEQECRSSHQSHQSPTKAEETYPRGQSQQKGVG